MSKLTNKPIPEKASHSEAMEKTAPTVAEVAYELIRQQYDRIIKEEPGVLADDDPECLHQMRVGSRRLCTALQVFSKTVTLPKAARQKRVRTLMKTLGKLRDLDVQIEAIREKYYPQINSAEQKQLHKLLKMIKKQRGQRFAEVKVALIHSHHHQLKNTYENWLKDPQYTAIAHLPLTLLLPELLSPLLANLLLHPAWLISVDDKSKASSRVLHDLRTTCKAVRYQAEFFTPYYGAAFQVWLDDLKVLQDNLGKLQDAWVFRQLLWDTFGANVSLPELEQVIQTEQGAALVNWEPLRHQYLNLDFRWRLHQMILEPAATFART